MIANMPHEQERKGTGRLIFGGVVLAILLAAAFAVWGFIFIPKGELGASARQPSAATGTLANQGSGESIAAKNNMVTPEKSAIGGGGQNSTGEARQIDQSAAPLKLANAQRRQIRSYFAGKLAARIPSADFALSVGAAVPRQVQLRPLPKEVSSAMQGFVGDQYILVRNELVIVDPSARRVVALVPQVG